MHKINGEEFSTGHPEVKSAIAGINRAKATTEIPRRAKPLMADGWAGRGPCAALRSSVSTGKGWERGWVCPRRRAWRGGHLDGVEGQFRRQLL
jgi:hypothetical protein